MSQQDWQPSWSWRSHRRGRSVSHVLKGGPSVCPDMILREKKVYQYCKRCACHAKIPLNKPIPLIILIPQVQVFMSAGLGFLISSIGQFVSGVTVAFFHGWLLTLRLGIERSEMERCLFSAHWHPVSFLLLLLLFRYFISDDFALFISLFLSRSRWVASQLNRLDRGSGGQRVFLTMSTPASVGFKTLGGNIWWKGDQSDMG